MTPLTNETDRYFINVSTQFNKIYNKGLVVFRRFNAEKLSTVRSLGPGVIH